MATVFKTRRGEVVGDYLDGGEHLVFTRDVIGDDAEVCRFCGDRNAAAHWQGVGGNVSVCQRCAVNVLRLLLADALVGEHGDLPYALPRASEALQEVLTHFWRGVSLAIARCVRVGGREPRRRNGR